MFVFRDPSPILPERLGDADGITAGSGMDGLGETDLRTDCDPKDERRLCDVGGGFIGNARD